MSGEGHNGGGLSDQGHIDAQAAWMPVVERGPRFGLQAADRPMSNGGPIPQPRAALEEWLVDGLSPQIRAMRVLGQRAGWANMVWGSPMEPQGPQTQRFQGRPWVARMRPVVAAN